jgi:Protein of unknown function (DUF3379)
MMDCAQFRRSMLADPHDQDQQLAQHRAGCQDCNLFAERLLRFESRLERALRVDVPAQVDSAADGVVQLRTKSRHAAAYRKGWLAMAASVLLAVVVAGVLWVAAPGTSLAADVVTHMAGEPGAWRQTDVPVPGGELQDVLRNSHLRLAAGANMVSYASSCAFRGHHVPHLVIQTESGPVTVMVLVHERVSKEVQFDEGGYRGVIVPVAGHGSIAVLTRGPATDLKTVEGIAARVLDSIQWTG